MFDIGFSEILLIAVVSLILGPALALVLILMLYTGTLLPVLAGAVYAAWKDLFAVPELPTAGSPAPARQDVFEA